jgi:uncharacterized membrane protein YbhN (UPF0104 family)
VTVYHVRRPAPRRPARAPALAFAAAAAIGLYLLLPQLAGLDETWRRLGRGDPWWLAAALGFEVLSYGCYVVVFRAVLARGNDRISLRASYEISLAGVAATRLFAAGGAGGIALTAWALRGSGQPARRVATSLTAFFVLLYSVFMAALLLGGAGLYLGVLPGRAPLGLTVVPAAFGGAAIGLALAFTLVPGDLDRRTRHGGRAFRLLTAVPATIGSGVRGALALLRSRDPRLAGALGWWAFDIAVLWACLHAFGAPPAIAVVVMAYFVGMLGNLVPLPGGIGGVEAGMIGALIGFGVATGLAIVAVLAYRAFAFWLPLIPGSIAYVRLLQRVHRWRDADGYAPSPSSRPWSST